MRTDLTSAIPLPTGDQEQQDSSALGCAGRQPYSGSALAGAASRGPAGLCQHEGPWEHSPPHGGRPAPWASPRDDRATPAGSGGGSDTAQSGERAACPPAPARAGPRGAAAAIEEEPCGTPRPVLLGLKPRTWTDFPVPTVLWDSQRMLMLQIRDNVCGVCCLLGSYIKTPGWLLRGKQSPIFGVV